MDQRMQELEAWALKHLSNEAGFVADKANMLMVSGDASFRRYFRMESGEYSWICVDAPPEKEDNPAFVEVNEALKAVGVSVPAVLAYDFELGFMLLEDFGDALYLPLLNEASVNDLYQAAFAELLKMQRCVASPAKPLPLYSVTLLETEMALFQDWFLQKLLNLSLTEEDLLRVARLRDCLVDTAMEQPTVFVHRDYHSRNIMFRPEQSPGIIDFQDAVMGPITYDLVSLLRDCYIAWPDDKVYEWVESFRLQLIEQGRVMPDATHFKRWFDLMGAQRHMKAVGIFARLNIRDGKSGYLADIPRTLNYLIEVTKRYYELELTATWLEERVVPAMYQSEFFEHDLLDQWFKK